MKYKCPLCDSPLSENHYHKVIKLQQRKETVQKGELERLRKESAAAIAEVKAQKSLVREAKLNAKRVAEEAKKQGELIQRKKSHRLMQGQADKIRKLQEKLKLMREGTNHQEVGLADEIKLVARLKGEFPDDQIEHAGKGGDVLHFVKLGVKQVGCIVYECKHTDRIATDHIDQTALAKKTRQADYGILVTTGTRKGFSGLTQESEIFIVAQAGVLTLAGLCRSSLVTMAEQLLDAEAKEKAAKRMMNYITSPACKIPLEQAISHTRRAVKNLQKEIKQHFGDWKERKEIYQSIDCDISHIKVNIRRVLVGDEPLKLEKPKFEPLLLPTTS